MRLVAIFTVIAVLAGIIGCSKKDVADEKKKELSEETYTFKVTHEEYADTVPDLYARELGRRIQEKSGGRINFEIYQVGQLGVGVDLIELLLTGSTHLAIVSPGNVATIVPEGQMFALHYLLPTDVEKTYKFLAQSNVVNKDLVEVYGKKNLKLFDLWPLGASQWLTDRKVSSPEDFTGLNFRTMNTPLIVKNYEVYGANPTPIAYTEVYSALQLNMVSGVENPVGALVDMKWYEVTKNLIFSNHIMYLEAVFMNKNYFEKLPEDIQNIIKETVREMHQEAYLMQKEANLKAEMILAENLETQNLTPQQINDFKEKAMEVRSFYKENSNESSVNILEKLEAELEAFK